MEEVKKIINNILTSNIAPVYILHGTEPYFIDQIVEVLDKNVVEENAQSFDKQIIYGKDTTIENIIDSAKKVPLLSPQQLIIIKEAQYLEKSIEKLSSYFLNPNPRTVLVICYKNKKIDARKKVYAYAKKIGVVLETKVLYENRVIGWIKEKAQEKGLSLHINSLHLLLEFLGTNLSRIDKELEKLKISITEKQEITPDIIEKYIGISKDFNNFELQKAVVAKNLPKALQIINTISKNPKDYPIQVTIIVLFFFFQKLLKYHHLSSKSKSNIAKVLGINPYFASDYINAATKFSLKKTTHALEQIHIADLKSKGIVGNNISPREILRELLMQLLMN